MLKKFFPTALASLLILTTCFAQTTPVKLTNVETQSKLSQADFYNVEPVKVDFEEETYKSQTKKNNLSGGAKTALWVSLFAAGIITVIVLATGKDKENNNRNSPCSISTSQVGVPCPPGCVCIQ
jgi:anaerobic C4-dicarboxylate transporter